jgi:hypothetical protein
MHSTKETLVFVNLTPTVAMSMVHPGAEIATYAVSIDDLFSADIIVPPMGMNAPVTVEFIAGADLYTFAAITTTDFNTAIDAIAEFAAAVA